MVAVVSDELSENTLFENSRDLIIVKNDFNSIVNIITSLVNQPKKMYGISKRGREKFAEIYSNEVQVKQRVDILKEVISDIK